MGFADQRFNVNLSILFTELPLLERPAAAAAAGFTAVELWWPWVDSPTPDQSELDALKMAPGPVIELHLSNIHRREAIYQKSLVSAVATAVIAGLGAAGYPLAVTALRQRLEA